MSTSQKHKSKSARKKRDTNQTNAKHNIALTKNITDNIQVFQNGIHMILSGSPHTPKTVSDLYDFVSNFVIQNSQMILIQILHLQEKYIILFRKQYVTIAKR